MILGWILVPHVGARLQFQVAARGPKSFFFSFFFLSEEIHTLKDNGSYIFLDFKEDRAALGYYSGRGSHSTADTCKLNESDRYER